MPSKKPEKPIQEMTTDELAQKVFPPKVLKRLKEAVAESDKPTQKRKRRTS